MGPTAQCINGSQLLLLASEPVKPKGKPEEPPGTEEAAPPPPPPALEQAQATAQAQAEAPAATAPAVDQAQVQAAWSAYYAQQAYFQQQQQAAHYGTCTLAYVLPTRLCLDMQQLPCETCACQPRLAGCPEQRLCGARAAEPIRHVS